MDDHFEILGVRQDATLKLSKQPTGASMPSSSWQNHASDATEAFQRLRHAWDILTDEKRRSTYDNQLKAEKLKYRPTTPAPPTPEPAKTPHTSHKQYSYNGEEEEVFSFEDLKDSPLGGSFQFQSHEYPNNSLRTFTNIASAKIELRKMETEYNTKLKHVASAIKAACARRNIQSEEEAMEDAEAGWEMVQHWTITAFERAIKIGFEELAKKLKESMEFWWGVDWR